MIINDIQFNCELEDVLSELISQLRANGSQLIAKQKDGPEHIQICCPYHANGMEHRPSAGIRKSDGVFHCFACGEVHSLQEVISYCFGYVDDVVGTFGWKWLLKNFATVQVEERKDVTLDFYRSDKPIGDIDSTDYVTEEELEKYRYIHPYMYKRRLTDDIIELFDIGYDKDTQCITFPVKDIKGNVLFIARRSVNSKFFHYPCGVLKPVYGIYEFFKDVENRTRIGKFQGQTITSGKYALLENTEMIVCESMLDALTCWVYGKYAVALNGLGTQEQFKQLRDLPCRKLILGTDNDEAGQTARTRIRYNIKNKLITEFQFPDGKKDINELSEDEFNSLEEIF